MNCKRVIYFHNGSIGDFLMVLHLMENLHANDTSIPLIIAVPRNFELCTELAAGYPYIEIVHVNRYTAPFILFRYMNGGNCVITPPTPGRLPLGTKLIAKLMTVFPNEKLIGFEDGATISRFLYDTLLEHDVTELYFETMHDVVHTLGFSVKVQGPSFSFASDQDVFTKMKITPSEYVFIHPFGSSRGRSILGNELERLVADVRQNFVGPILLSGSPADAENHKETIERLEKDLGVMSIAGMVSITELATLLERARLFIGVDTGITHLASCIGVRSLVIAHNGTPHWLPYYNKNSCIVYQIVGDTSGIHTGREHLEKMRDDRVRYLDRIPHSIVRGYVEKMLSE